MATPEDSPAYQEALCGYLAGFITERKRAKIEAALRHRTRHLSIVLEDIYQPHNASAVLRSCDCLGVQDIHIIENRNSYRPNPGVAMGSSKWLSLFYYRAVRDDAPNEGARSPELRKSAQRGKAESGASSSFHTGSRSQTSNFGGKPFSHPSTETIPKEAFQNNTKNCLQTLREKGYRIVATSPHKTAPAPSDFPIDRPAAFLFGAEETGLSDTALAEADSFLRIPMYGFTESYNLSVSAALVLSRIIERLRNSGHPFGLSRQEKTELRLEWYRRILRRHELLEKRFRENYKGAPKA